MELKNANNDSILDINKVMQDVSSVSVTDSDDDGKDPNYDEVTSNNKCDRTAELKNNAPCTSRRQKISPVMRNKDFLWTVGSLKTIDQELK